MVDGERGRTVIPYKETTGFRPVWGGTFEAWAKNYVNDNLWRVDKLFMFEDALQECALIFVRVARHYEDRIDNPAWLMSLFRIAVVNDFHTLARRNQRIDEAEAAAAELYEEGVDHPAGPLMALLNKASAELREVLRVIAVGPSELISLMLDGTAEPRESVEPAANEAAMSRSLCRLARVKNVRSDLLSELRALLTRSPA
jgi:hypothetical protein